MFLKLQGNVAKLRIEGGLANRGKVALASAVYCVRGSQCIKEQPRPGQQGPENFKTAETVDCQTTEAYSGSYLQTLQCREDLLLKIRRWNSELSQSRRLKLLFSLSVNQDSSSGSSKVQPRNVLRLERRALLERREEAQHLRKNFGELQTTSTFPVSLSRLSRKTCVRWNS